MNFRRLTTAVALVTLIGCGHDVRTRSDAPNHKLQDDFAVRFEVPKSNFASTGRNDYFILEPGYQLTLRNDKGEQLVVAVTDQTKTVDGVETRIVEERETKNDQPVEISRNYFAIDKTTNNIYYFGEDVDIYKDGKVSGHEGGWQSGQNGARYGLFMPSHPRVGQKFYQEIAPKVAMDRCEIVSTSDKVKVPAGAFDHCVKTRETTPLEPDDKEYKFYAPGVGLLIDGDLKLASYSK